MRTCSHLASGLAIILVGILVAFAFGALDMPSNHASPPAATAASARPVPDFKHIFVIVMENKDYARVMNSDQASYIHALAQQYALASNYYGIRHPSLPNYLALTGGDTFGVTSDCNDCFVSQPNLVDQLEAGGKSWKAYMEGMPSPCFVGNALPLYR
jgi:acid phosphatase